MRNNREKRDGRKCKLNVGNQKHTLEGREKWKFEPFFLGSKF